MIKQVPYCDNCNEKVSDGVKGIIIRGHVELIGESNFHPFKTMGSDLTTTKDHFDLLFQTKPGKEYVLCAACLAETFGFKPA